MTLAKGVFRVLPQAARSGGALALLVLALATVPGTRALAREAPPESAASANGRAGDATFLRPATVIGRDENTAVGHNAGRLTLELTNLGMLGNPYLDRLSAGWRGGEYLFFAGLWVGAIGEDGEPHVSQTASPRAPEWRPSLLPVDHLYEASEGENHGLRPGFTRGDDDGDGQIDEDFENGKDDDGDGRIDEDYAAIGQQMFSCEYRDDTPEALAQINDHVPLGLRVRQRSFQWSTPGLDEFVGIDFEVKNVGGRRLRNVYIGFYVDADAGPKDHADYFADDLVGFSRVDTTVTNPTAPGGCGAENLSLDIAWIHDVPDDRLSTPGGDVTGWLGVLFLGHSTDPTGEKAPRRVGLTTVRWTSAAGAYPEGDPRTDFERYDLLSNGGLPARSAQKPSDYRYTLAAGPFAVLEPGDELSFQVAIVIGDGYAGMIRNAIAAQRIFNGTWIDGDLDPLTGVEGRETCLRVTNPPGQVLWDDPCDSLATVTAYRGTDCLWVDDDCNPCTGQQGRELRLHWVGATAPAPPETNTSPGVADRRIQDPELVINVGRPGRDRGVVLQWDNGSELRRDPLSGEEIFEGYRIWRVDRWNRPEGSNGPAPDEWMLLDEYRRHPRDGRGEGSPHHLRRVLHAERTEQQGESSDGPHYQVGRYEWNDDRGVLNGHVYFYAVTAFGIRHAVDPVTGALTEVEISGQPAASQRDAIIPSWDPGGGCADIRVVPNPYRGGASWDLRPSDCDPTGTKVAIARLPEDWSTLRIYTLAGDLVLSATPDDSRVLAGCSVSDLNRQSGTFFWNLLSRNGQNVVAGIYLYAVETPRAVCRGRFVIIR